MGTIMGRHTIGIMGIGITATITIIIITVTGIKQKGI